MATDLGTWLAALITLGLMSFAWRENPFYRLVEHVYVAVGASHALVMGYDVLVKNFWGPLTEKGDVTVIIPAALGLMLYFRFSKGKIWLSRFPIAVLVGLGTGLSIGGSLKSQFVAQVKATMNPLNTFDNIFIFIAVTSVLCFFYFTFKRKSGTPLYYYSTVGRFIMMFAFGALFGNTVMGRMSLMIGRVKFLLSTWLGLV